MIILVKDYELWSKLHCRKQLFGLPPFLIRGGGHGSKWEKGGIGRTLQEGGDSEGGGIGRGDQEVSF